MKPQPKKTVGFGTFKNVLLLGAAGLGGWWVFNHVITPALGKSGGGDSGKNPGSPPPNLNGQTVLPGKTSIVMSNVCIKEKEDRFIYTPVIFTFKKLIQMIKSPVKGHFTGRMLCDGPIKFAEIYPR